MGFLPRDPGRISQSAQTFPVSFCRNFGPRVFCTYTPTPWQPRRPSATRTPTVSETVARSRRCCRRDAGRRTRRCRDTRGRTGARRDPRRRPRTSVPESLTRASSPERSSRKSLFRSAGSGRDASASAGVDNSATGRSSTVRTRALSPGYVVSVDPRAGGDRGAVCQRARGSAAAAVPGRLRARIEQRTRACSVSQSARFTGEFPLAHIAFRDRRMPVQVSLDAFSPFIPHDADDSGLPVAVLRYTVKNPGRGTDGRVDRVLARESAADVPGSLGTRKTRESARHARLLASGLLLSNPAIGDDNPLAGTLGLWVLGAGDGRVSCCEAGRVRAGGRARCISGTTSRTTAQLGPESAEPGPVAAVCLQRTIAPGASADFTFVISWRFPNRTPERCGWDSGIGRERRPDRQPLLRAVRGRLGGGAVSRRPPDAARARARAALRRRSDRARSRRRRRTARRRTCRHWSPRPASARRTASSTDSKAAAKPADAATATARTSGTTRPRPPTCFRASRDRSAAPPSATRWTTMAACASGSRCRMAPSGFRQQPQTVRWARSSRSIWTGGSRVTTRSCKRVLAAREAGHRVRLDSGWMGRGSGRRARRRAAQHVRHRVLRSESDVRHLLPGRAASRRGDGARRWATMRRARRSAGCSTRAAAGSTRTCSTASTTFSRCAASAARTFRTRC